VRWLLVILLLPAVAAPAEARVSARGPAVTTTGDVVHVRGRAGRAGRVVVERRTASGWRSLAAGRARRRFALRFRAPSRRGVMRLRVRSSRAGVSRSWPMAIAPVEVVRAASVSDAPPPGEAGRVRLASHAAVSRGGFIAAGVGPATPSGFLARVVAVRGDGTYDTVPATLAEAVPQGSISTARVSAAAARPARRFGLPLSCGPGVTGSVDGSLSAALDPSFGLAWSHGRVTHAHASAALRGGVDIGVEVSASGGCALEPSAVASWTAPPLRFLAGPIPVVVVPRTKLYVSADAQVAAPVATRVHGSVRALGGLRYDGSAHPVASFAQQLSADRPSVRGQASVAAHLTPSVELLLYGQAGPRIDLGTGVQLDASPGSPPRWQVSVPVALRAGLRLPGIELAPRTVFSRTLPLARSAAGAPGAPPSRTGGERARISWDTGADVDLHVWDGDGRHASYRESGIPGVLLSKDDTNGFGPEVFTEDSPPSRRFTYGLCYFDARGASATTVAVHLTDADGGTRDLTRTLSGEGDSALLGSSPPDATFTPPSGWCQGRH
jgi:hypothetical protein